MESLKPKLNACDTVLKVMGSTSRKSGPEQTRRLPEFTLIITIIYIYFLTTGDIGRVLMFLSIRVVTKVEGSNSGDATTTSAHLRRSDRGEFLTILCGVLV